jgi:hypothetical protein
MASAGGAKADSGQSALPQSPFAVDSSSVRFNAKMRSAKLQSFHLFYANKLCFHDTNTISKPINHMIKTKFQISQLMMISKSHRLFGFN